jgi:hypothetical protein
MDLFQILAQQGSRPDRGVISHLAGIGIDDLGNQGVDDPQSRGGTTLTRTVREAGMEIKPLALREAIHPIVGRLAADVEQLGDVLHSLPLSEPQHSLGSAEFLR